MYSAQGWSLGKWQSYFLEQDGMFALDHQPAVFSLYLSKEPARKSLETRWIFPHNTDEYKILFAHNIYPCISLA